VTALTLATVGEAKACYGKAVAALRPSEYTAALIQALHSQPDWASGAHALDIGCGSGVVLAAMGELGAASLCGVDIEPTAAAASRRLLQELGFGNRLEMFQGDMWRPIFPRRFDLIAANLPQFPMEPAPVPGRLPSWSTGGRDGRRLLDRFIEALPRHLAPGGRALITHNAFIDLEQTRTMLARDALCLRVAMTLLVSLSEEKLELMTPEILCAEEGHSIHRYRQYAFGEMHVVEIGAAATLS